MSPEVIVGVKQGRAPAKPLPGQVQLVFDTSSNMSAPQNKITIRSVN